MHGAWFCIQDKKEFKVTFINSSTAFCILVVAQTIDKYREGHVK